MGERLAQELRRRGVVLVAKAEAPVLGGGGSQIQDLSLAGSCLCRECPAGSCWIQMSVGAGSPHRGDVFLLDELPSGLSWELYGYLLLYPSVIFEDAPCPEVWRAGELEVRHL